MTEVIDTPEDESIAAKYWHDLYVTTLKNAQDYAAKVGEDIGRLERELQIGRGCDYENGFLHGAQHQMKSSVDKAVNAMSQTAQEPVAWMVYTQDGQSVYVTDNPTDIQEGQRALPLYTAPPQRPWVGLTDEDIESWDLPDKPTIAEFARFLEAKIKEKNHD